MSVRRGLDFTLLMCGKKNPEASFASSRAHYHNAGVKFHFKVEVREVLYYVRQVNLYLLDYNKLISIRSCI